MNFPSLRSAVALTAALTTAFSPLLVGAQPSYEFKKYTPGLAAVPSPQPGVQLSTSAINFGEVATNTTETRQVLVSNPGKGSLSFTAAPTVTGNAAFAAGLTTCGTTLAAGADCLTYASFSPTSAGTYNGVLKFTSALASSPHEVALAGSAFNPVSLASTTRLEGSVGQAYSYDFKQLLAVSNETSPDKSLATWSSSGELPAGLSFNTSTGILAGTPTVAGTSTGISITVSYKSNNATQSFSLVVHPSVSVVMHGSGYRVWSDGTVANSCLGYRQPPVGYAYTGSVGDGLYRVKPAGQAETTVYCDMTSDGGGWTRVVGINVANRNHINAAEVPWTGTLGSGTEMGKFADTFINSLKSSVRSTTIGYRLVSTQGSKSYFPASCTFSSTMTAAGDCTSYVTVYAETPAWTTGGDTSDRCPPPTYYIGVSSYKHGTCSATTSADSGNVIYGRIGNSNTNGMVSSGYAYTSGALWVK